MRHENKATTKTEDGQRRKIWCMPFGELKAILNHFNDGEYMACPVYEEIPATARIVAVREDFERHAMAILVEDKSFAIVPLGERCPVVGNLKRRVFERIAKAKT